MLWHLLAKPAPAIAQKVAPVPQIRAPSTQVTRVLREQLTQKHIEYVPVFGYLSLRTDNHRELGLPTQSDVKPGEHVVNATLPGYGLDVVASTVYRGNPRAPGVVAGLRADPHQTMPGVVLKIPLARAEELLAIVFKRELSAESDLVEDAGNMYIPVVREVVLETGERIPALAFVSDPSSARAITRDGYFDENGLTAARLAVFMLGEGGFIAEDGRVRGGLARDYWSSSYVAEREKRGQPISPLLLEAIALSRMMPADVQSLPAHLKNTLDFVFEGATVPSSLMRLQKSERKDPQSRIDNPDAVARLQARYETLLNAGVLDAEGNAIDPQLNKRKVVLAETLAATRAGKGHTANGEVSLDLQLRWGEAPPPFRLLQGDNYRRPAGSEVAVLPAAQWKLFSEYYESAFGEKLTAGQGAYPIWTHRGKDNALVFVVPEGTTPKHAYAGMMKILGTTAADGREGQQIPQR